MVQLLQLPVRPVERRTATVQLRVRPSERVQLIEQARAAGFRRVSEYVRCLASAATGPRSAP